MEVDKSQIVTPLLPARLSGYLCTKSLYRSRAGRHFYGTENVIWAGFGPKKKFGLIMSNF